MILMHASCGRCRIAVRKVTYEWARTGANEIVCKITNSVSSNMAIHGYIPWDHNPPNFSVLDPESPDKRFLRGRSWIPETRDGMRWVLALSKPYEQSVGTATGNWIAFLSNVESLYLCGKQGQTYEELERQTSAWLEPSRID